MPYYYAKFTFNGSLVKKIEWEGLATRDYAAYTPTKEGVAGSNDIWSSTLTILDYPSTSVFYYSLLLDPSGCVFATIFQSVYSINVKGKANMICIFTRAGY